MQGKQPISDQASFFFDRAASFQIRGVLFFFVMSVHLGVACRHAMADVDITRMRVR